MRIFSSCDATWGLSTAFIAGVSDNWGLLMPLFRLIRGRYG